MNSGLVRPLTASEVVGIRVIVARTPTRHLTRLALEAMPSGLGDERYALPIIPFATLWFMSSTPSGGNSITSGLVGSQSAFVLSPPRQIALAGRDTAPA